jgi:hypothetical protein
MICGCRLLISRIASKVAAVVDRACAIVTNDSLIVECSDNQIGIVGGTNIVRQ